MGSIQCPECGAELHGAFCSECGNEIIHLTKKSYEDEKKKMKEDYDAKLAKAAWKNVAMFFMSCIIGYSVLVPMCRDFAASLQDGTIVNEAKKRLGFNYQTEKKTDTTQEDKNKKKKNKKSKKTETTKMEKKTKKSKNTGCAP